MRPPTNRTQRRDAKQRYPQPTGRVGARLNRRLRVPVRHPARVASAGVRATAARFPREFTGSGARAPAGPRAKWRA